MEVNFQIYLDDAAGCVRKGENMNQKELNRINELARKSKAVGLTDQEKEEQARLRRLYIESVRMNLRSQLDAIDVRDRKSVV